METIRRMGLVGGISWGATAEYYRRINLEVKRRLGGHHSADMIIRSLDLHPLLENANDVAAIETVFAQAGRALLAAGSEVLAVASFTGHRYIRPLRALPLPFVDLIDSVGVRLKQARVQRLAVWATSYALADAELLERLESASGAALLTPPEHLRTDLDNIVFTELADQTASEASLELLRNLQRHHASADALLLATTDFSVIAPILNTVETRLPLYDATEIHCAALVDAVLQR